MKDKYKDLIGKVCYGLDNNGTIWGIGWYLGMNEINKEHSITNNYNSIGKNPNVCGSDYHDIKAIETNPISPVLEHYGKEAWVWDNNNRSNAIRRTLIFTHKDGRCRALDNGGVLEDFELGLSNSIIRWDHYELIEESIDIDINISIGSETNLTIDQAIDKLKRLKEMK